MASKQDQVKIQFNADAGQFNKEIQQANSELTKLRSELKLNKTQMDATGQSVDGLADRQRILEQEATASASKVEALTQKLELAKNTYGENSTEAQKLATQLNNARSAHERINQQIDQTKQALDQERSAAAQAESAMGKLESAISKQESELKSLKTQYSNVALEQGQTSTEAQQLAGKIQALSRDLDKNKSSLNEARSAADRLEKEFDQVGDAAREAGDDISLLDGAAGLLSAGGIAAAAGSLAGLEESTRQYRNEQNKLKAVAETSGQSLDDLTGSYENLYGITGDSTLSSTAVLNMSAMGVSVEDQERLVTAATGAWAQYGDSIPLDGLMEATNETSRTGTVTGVLADALNWTGYTAEEFSNKLSSNSDAQGAFNKAIEEGLPIEDAFNAALEECGDTSERQRLITDVLSGAYGELGEKYKEVNSDVIEANQASAEMESAMGQLGEAVQPVTTWFQNLISDGLQWLLGNLPTLTPLIVAFAVAFGGLTIVAAISSGFFGLSSILAPIGAAFTAISAPVVAVIAVFALLAAGLVALWNNSETFRNGVMQLGDTIQQIFGTLADWFMQNVVTPIVSYFQSLQPQLEAIWNAISTLIDTVMGVISGFISDNMGTIQAVWSTVWGAISGVVSTIWSIIQTVINTALGVIEGIIKTVTGIISGDWSMVWEGISQVFSSIWNGISDFIGNIINGISNTIGNVLSGISDTVSSILDGIGGFFEDTFGGIGDTVSSVIDDAKNVVSGGLDAIAGFFSGLHIEFPHINLPHFSISGSFSLNPPSIPTIGIEWYAKGGILNAPTIFGSSGGKLLGGGEAGPEAVLPIEMLQGFIDVAFERNASGDGVGAIIDAIDGLSERVISLEIDGKQIARAIAAPADRVNGNRQMLVRRGLSI